MIKLNRMHDEQKCISNTHTILFWIIWHFLFDLSCLLNGINGLSYISFGGVADLGPRMDGWIAIQICSFCATHPMYSMAKTENFFPHRNKEARHSDLIMSGVKKLPLRIVYFTTKIFRKTTWLLTFPRIYIHSNFISLHRIILNKCIQQGIEYIR